MQRYLLSLAVLAATGPANASCGSAFCSVNTHWDTQGLSSGEGLRLDLRYSYARANQLRAGASRLSPEAPGNSGAEIEDRRTINQLLNIDVDYAINGRWNIALGIPLVRRDHRHTFDPLVGDAFTQQAKFTELGDLRIVGKYKLAAGGMEAGSGLRCGLKLPSGAINKTMSPPDPADPGQPYALERSSQPGSGSTDAILGAYYFRNYPEYDWGWFVSAQFQSPLAIRDHYRPGSEVALDLGLHYELGPSWNVLLQLNGQYRDRDTGRNANVASGGYAWYLSPGLSYALSMQTQIYGVWQIAVRQYVNTDPAEAGSGQLTAPWSLALGISQRF